MPRQESQDSSSSIVLVGFVEKNTEGDLITNRARKYQCDTSLHLGSNEFMNVFTEKIKKYGTT